MTTLETRRLVLRPWRDDDLDPLAAIFAEPAFWHYPFGRGFTREETEAFLDRQLDHWAAHGFGSWAAELKAGGALIGYIGLAIPTWLPQVMPAVEVGWRLHSAHWGRGLATEGGRSSLAHGFGPLGLDRIIAIVMPENVASRRVMAKLGMVAVSTARDAEREVDLEVHEITGRAWAVRNAYEWFEVNSGWAARRGRDGRVDGRRGLQVSRRLPGRAGGMVRARAGVLVAGPAVDGMRPRTMAG